MIKTIKALLVAAVFATMATVQATSMIPANLGLIVQYTERGFTGTAVSMTTVQTPQGWADEVTFKVTDPIIGAINVGDTVKWFQARVGEDAPIPGMPTYEIDGEYTIFLTAKAPGSQFQAPYTLGQGTFRVHRDSETGAAFARNEFQNAALFNDMDTEALAVAIVDADPATKAANRDTKVKATNMKLTSLRAGAIDLDSLKNAAKALKASGAARTKFTKKGGASNSTKVSVQP